MLPRRRPPRRTTTATSAKAAAAATTLAAAIAVALLGSVAPGAAAYPLRRVLLGRGRPPPPTPALPYGVQPLDMDGGDGGGDGVVSGGGSGGGSDGGRENKGDGRKWPPPSPPRHLQCQQERRMSRTFPVQEGVGYRADV